VPFPSGTTYTPNETGTIMRVEDASVLSSREVKISGLDNKQAAGWGTAIGAAVAGTSAYGITKTDNPAGVASGKSIAVVQSLGSGGKIYPPGTHVSLIYGARNYVRVVPAPS
jgi:outer membrane lipoprotein SlyB